jgi:hypothetical protein
LRAVDLKNRDDPMTRMIAKKIAVFQKSGLARYFAHSFLTDHTGTVSVVSYGTERFPAG